MSEETLTLKPFSKPLENACVRLPGSKSISNRALLLASLSDSYVVLKGLLKSEDTDFMLDCLRKLGVSIEELGSDMVKVTGAGRNLPVEEADLYVGTAGTVARLLIGILGTQKRGTYRIDGSEVMRKRPMAGLTDLLQQIGCEVEFLGEEGALPFILKPKGFSATELTVDASASSQILSAVLMASVMADEDVRIRLSNDTVRQPYVIMTSRMMQSFGAPAVQWNEAFTEFVIPAFGRYRYDGAAYTIESDASAASYFLTLPLVTDGALDVYHFDGEGLQGDVAYADVARSIGARVQTIGSGVRVSYPDRLVRPLTYNFHPISDTFMTLAAVAPLLSKPVRIEGIAHTRQQESDRVSAMVTELKKLGQHVEEEQDALHIFPDYRALLKVAKDGVEIETYKDHRIAMSFGILGCKDLFGDQFPWMTIRDPYCCAKTFPQFFDVLDSVRT